MAAERRPLRLTLRGRSVAVTGGAGFIGSHLVDRLVDYGPRRIVVIDDLSLGRRANLNDARRRHEGIRLYVADASRARVLSGILRKERIDVLFSLATNPLPASHVHPLRTVDRIVRLATVAAELARRGEFRTLIHCSSSEVYGTAIDAPMSEAHPLAPRTPYAAAKAAADLIIRSYWETFDIDATIVRPFNAYGPRQNEADYAAVVPATLRRIREGRRPVIFGDGTQTRDLTFVKDTARALVDAYRKPQTRRRVINIGSGREITIAELVSRIGGLAGRALPPMHAAERKADVRRLVADVSLAQELIGFRTRTPVDVGLRRTVAWYLARDAGRWRRASI